VKEDSVAVTGLHHVQLSMPPAREASAERFYAGVLGIRRVPKPPELEARGGCWFRSHAVEVHLGVETDFRPARKAHPAFLVRDLEALRARLEASGADVIDDVRLDGRRRFHAADPFGNRLEFIEGRPDD
jgi:catechol 2,3-dioxygenase-like lactoylglutathione lyase family enzyme